MRPNKKKHTERSKKRKKKSRRELIKVNKIEIDDTVKQWNHAFNKAEKKEGKRSICIRLSEWIKYNQLTALECELCAHTVLYNNSLQEAK